MRTHPFGDLGFDVNPFGLGCMRMLMRDGMTDEKAVELIRLAIDSGVNYLDTAYIYGDGHSEEVLGMALKDGYRDRVRIATKLPTQGENPGKDDFDRIFFTSLERLGVEYIDFYLLHGINKRDYDKLLAGGILEWLDRKVEQGLIRWPGFSFHDDYDTFVRILDSYPFRMAQIQLNILDTAFQAGIRGLEYAGKKGVPVVIMEPLRGGALARPLPGNVREVYGEAPRDWSPIEYAFRFLYDRPEVAVVLSGIMDEAQLAENLRIADVSHPGCLTEADKAFLERVAEAYRSRANTGCTGCRYCMPCPFGVEIPRIFSAVDRAEMFEDSARLERDLAAVSREGHGPDLCRNCGACAKRCPQQLPIPERMQALAGR